MSVNPKEVCMTKKKLITLAVLCAFAVLIILMMAFLVVVSIIGHSVMKILASATFVLPLAAIVTAIVLLAKDKIICLTAVITIGITSVISLVMFTGIFTFVVFAHTIFEVSAPEDYDSFVEMCSGFDDEEVAKMFYDAKDNTDCFYYHLDLASGFEYAETFYVLSSEEFEKESNLMKQRSLNDSNYLEGIDLVEKYTQIRPLSIDASKLQLDFNDNYMSDDVYSVLLKSDENVKCGVLLDNKLNKIWIFYFNTKMVMHW